MFALRRKAASPAGAVRAVRSAQFSSSAHARGGHGADHGHAAPRAEESLGPQVYATLAALPAMWLLYKMSQPSADGQKPAFSRMIDSYAYLQDQFAARNKVHTAMVEQAAFDRNLFQSDKKTQHIPMRFPEVFNTGAPYNISAGQGARGIEELVAHYEKINNDAEDKKVEKLRAQAA